MLNDGIKLSGLIAGCFRAVWKAVRDHEYNHFWLKGGRGSTKSSFISICIVLLVMLHPFANAVVIRRVGNTLRDSVYQQVLWAISILGVSKYFHPTYAPLEIIYKPTGQRIVFRGADDPMKLKSTKFSEGYSAIIWFEELDQFEGIEVIRSILNSLRRGGEKFWCFYSYNPPKTAWSWVNRECLQRENRNDTLVHTSSYLDVIDEHPEWLGQPFIDEAEYLRDTNERAYRWEYLGEITGTGGNVFDNVVPKAITNDEILTFDRVRNGVDWGWFPDPWRFVRCEWRPASKSLIIFEEHSRHKSMPRDTGLIVKNALTYPNGKDGKPVFHNQLIWYDDTPDGKVQGNTYRREIGLKARPARKGGMRDYSYQWLAGLHEIVIDPKRCPLTYEEFTLKEYAKDRNDEWIEDIPDGNDHSIDAVRYAMMEDIRRSA